MPKLLKISLMKTRKSSSHSTSKKSQSFSFTAFLKNILNLSLV